MTYSLPLGYLSPTQLNSYRDCPRCYELAYVKREPKPTSIHYAIGTCAHAAAEHVARQIIARREVDPEEALTLGAQAFERKLDEPFDEERVELIWVELGKYKHLGQAKDDAVAITRHALTKLPQWFADRGVIATETDLADLPANALAAAFPFPVRGRMDFLYGDLHDMTPNAMTDLKTSSRREAPSMNNRLQFSFYGLPAHMLGFDWRIGADVLVKTKSPDIVTYWGNGSGHLSAKNYEVAREIILQVAGDISAERFPIGQGWNGKHDYDHGLDEYKLAVQGFAA